MRLGARAATALALIAVAAVGATGPRGMISQELSSQTPVVRTAVGTISDFSVTQHITAERPWDPDRGLTPWTFMVTYTFTRAGDVADDPVCGAETVQATLETVDGRRIALDPREIGCEAGGDGQSVRLEDVMDTNEGASTIKDITFTVRDATGRMTAKTLDLEPHATISASR